jgi:hypothetical protein
MAGTIVVDRLESDASYASSINVASPLVVSNTISLGSAAVISGNVNIDNGTLFVNQNNNRVGIGGITNPSNWLDVNNSISITENGVANSNTSLELYSRFSDNQRGYVILKAESNSSGSSDLVVRSRNNFSEAERFRIDSVGRVRIPNQPAASIRFAAGSYTGGTIRDATFSSLTDTDYNIGGHMNTSTGVFTCPVAGMYLCNTIWYNGTGNNGYMGVITAKNGSTYGMFWYNDDQGYGDDSVMDSRIVQASAGDTLRVQLYGVSNDSTPEIQFQVYYLG